MIASLSHASNELQIQIRHTHKRGDEWSVHLKPSVQCTQRGDPAVGPMPAEDYINHDFHPCFRPFTNRSHIITNWSECTMHLLNQSQSMSGYQESSFTLRVDASAPNWSRSVGHQSGTTIFIPCVCTTHHSELASSHSSTSAAVLVLEHNLPPPDPTVPRHRLEFVKVMVREKALDSPSDVGELDLATMLLSLAIGLTFEKGVSQLSLSLLKFRMLTADPIHPLDQTWCLIFPSVLWISSTTRTLFST